MSTKVSIISSAISLLGHKPIITLDNDDADDLVIAAEQAFDFYLPASMSENTWRFATRITQLSLVAGETPPTKWTKVHLLPAGYLKTVRLYPHTYDYDIYEDLKIFSNFSGPVYMEHIFQPDIARLPAWFVKAFVFEIAAHLALSNAQKADYYTVLETKRTTQMAIAMGIDAANRPNSSMANFPMLNITSGSSVEVINP